MLEKMLDRAEINNFKLERGGKTNWRGSCKVTYHWGRWGFWQDSHKCTCQPEWWRRWWQSGPEGLHQRGWRETGSLHLHRATITTDQMTRGSTCSNSSHKKATGPPEMTHIHVGCKIQKILRKQDNFCTGVFKCCCSFSKQDKKNNQQLWIMCKISIMRKLQTCEVYTIHTQCVLYQTISWVVVPESL